MPSPMKNAYSRMYFRLFFCVCFAFTIYDARAQAPGDSTMRRLHYRYSSITLLSGYALQFYDRRPGLLSAQFSYSTNAAPGNSNFWGEIADPYGSVKSYALPLFFEYGRLYHFTNFGLAFPVVKGQITSGFHLI